MTAADDNAFYRSLARVAAAIAFASGALLAVGFIMLNAVSQFRYPS